MRVKYSVSAAVTVLILVAMFVSLARHFWLGVGLALLVDAGLIWWGVREFIRDNHVELPPREDR
jgi:hypothetical protein